MLTVNSLSGGKTSSYIAAHYPADLDVFALVCIDNHNANVKTSFKVDAKMRQMVNDKLQKYCADMPEFKATAEDPITIKTMFDLEQHIGREITWVRGVGFSEMVTMKKMIPNQRHRFCTTILKIEPIFRLLYLHHELPVKMRIGFRADEKDRADDFKESFKFAICSQLRDTPKKGGKGKTEWFQRWSEIPFREGEFVLIDDNVVHYDVQKYWQQFNVPFPNDSNCQFCPHKSAMQKRLNWNENPSVMMSGAIIEEIKGNTFDGDFSILDINKINIQTDLFGGFSSGCHGGYCTA